MRALAIAVLLAFAPAVARADDLRLDENDPEVEERLRFLEERLALEARSARTWESLWSIVDVGGAGYGAYELSKHDTRAETASGFIGLVKAGTGLVFLTVLPLNATRGAREMQQRGEKDTDRLGRLGFAERVLYRNAVDAEVRFTWRPHVIALALNIAGGIIIGALGDWKRAGESMGIGVLGSEAQIWTRPWRARRDLREYRARFGNVLPPEPPPRAALKVGASSLSVAF